MTEAVEHHEPTPPVARETTENAPPDLATLRGPHATDQELLYALRDIVISLLERLDTTKDVPRPGRR